VPSDGICASIDAFGAESLGGRFCTVSGICFPRKRSSRWLAYSGSDVRLTFAAFCPFRRRIPLRNTVVHKGDVFPVGSVSERLFSTAICRQFEFREMSCASAKTVSTVSATAGLLELPHLRAIFIRARLDQGSFVVGSRCEQSRLVILDHIVLPRWVVNR
jgi:hypothetical protein